MTSTAITDVYGAFVTFVSGTLTSYKKVANPYKLEDNPSGILKKGYGVKIGHGTNGGRFVGGFHSTKRVLTVVLTNEVAAVEANSTAWKDAELELMEDVQSLIKGICTSSAIATKVTNVAWVDDSGIGFVEGDRCRYFSVEVAFSAEYIESN